jgi:hypothetical protein
MFEVKIVVKHGTLNIPVTIATFGPGLSYGALKARRFAIDFARAIDPGFETTVTEVANEDNREKAFGLVYGRTAAV